MIEKKYNLEERTTRFSEHVIDFVRSLRKDSVNSPLISQLVRSATSIGANYFEANGASSNKDFRNKIYICKKEARETKYWLDIIGRANSDAKEKIKHLAQEAHELTLIFSKILITLEKK